MQRARNRLLEAQKDFHLVRQVVLKHRERKDDFMGWQIAEYAYEHHRDALYAAMSWLWDVQQRARPSIDPEQLAIWMTPFPPYEPSRKPIEMSMTARRKEAA